MRYWIIAACVLCVPVLAIVKNLNKSKNYKNRAPGPPGLPVIGNLHQLGSRPHRFLFEQSKKYGPLMCLKLGNVPTVVASTPETAKEILKTYDLDCCTRPHMACPARLTFDLKDLVFSPYDEYWRDLRKMSVLELYSARRVHSFRHIREEQVRSFIGFIRQSAAVPETPVNLSHEFLSLSASVICRIAFGISKLEDKYDEVILQALNLLGAFSAADFFPYFGWIIDRLSGLHSRREKIFQELNEFYEQVIKRHEGHKSQEGHEDIVDLLLKMEKEQLGLGHFQLTRNHIKAILLNILLASDTAAQALTWLMTRLITNPGAMKKAQAEVREHIKSKDNIAGEDIEQLKYLKMVIKETFRINPLVPLLVPREAMTDLKINGYDVPKKTRIQVNLWAIGHNPDIWKDPEDFIPERFMNNHIDYKGQNFELLPFGSGRRMCPGMNMGMSLVHLTLVNLLYRFDWKLPKGTNVEDVDLEEVYGRVTPKKVPLHLVPVQTRWT